MALIHDEYDIAVVGAGHAGCEAALAAARLGLKTVVFTVSVDAIAMMPCNPNIGGTSKGHLVREIDALGGEMGKNIDKVFIQSKMLNRSKGPAVHSLRAQADKQAYSREMRRTMENTDGLAIRQGEVTDVLVEDGKVTGVKISTGQIYPCRAAVLATGVYLNARCLTGETITYTGPNGLMAATHLTENLKKKGIEFTRFKTGTPARIDKRTIDFSKLVEQKGDERIVPFSFSTDPETIQKEQVSCYLAYTNEKTHEIIRKNLHRSPLYAGVIEGVGPRYCPSIEDKVVRFGEKDRHQIFIEPEGTYTNEMYLSGMSSSMPADVQDEMYRSMEGLENAHIVRNAYAIEYDCIPAVQLKPTLELKSIEGLFAAGQINGSSGYEEAGAQGIIAGINAAMYLLGKEQVVLKRSDAYIGVLIDDLVTKRTKEPYRMMTSRAEYRLLLRQDNADQRLCETGHKVGLVDEETYLKVREKYDAVKKEVERLKGVSVGAGKRTKEFLESMDSSHLKTAATLAEILRRPEIHYDDLKAIDDAAPALPDAVKEQVEIYIKYEGYIEREIKQVEEFKRIEGRLIPEDIDYKMIKGLRIEAMQKLSEIRPENLGQASRISGVSPADISVLLIYLSSKAGAK